MLSSTIVTGGLSNSQKTLVKKDVPFDMVQLQKGADFIDKVNRGQITLLSKEAYEKQQLKISKQKTYDFIWHKKTKEWLYELGHKESGNNPTIVNRYGYIGKWQFGKAALEYTGYGHVTVMEFKNNPDIFDEYDQYDAMIKYTKANRRILTKYIKEYEGTMINGVLITESGILAGAHIGGAGGVIKYLKSNGKFNPKDANLTSIEDYISMFSGYEIKLA